MAVRKIVFARLGATLSLLAAFAVAQTARTTLPADHQPQIVTVSPDASRFVYAANNRLYSKTFDDAPPVEIRGTASGQPVTFPVFSPNGKYLAFWSAADQSIRRIGAAGGGEVLTICKADSSGMSWEAGDVIVFGTGRGGIMRVSANGGTPETIATVKEGEFAFFPRLLPGGKAVLYTAINLETAGGALWDAAQIVVQPIGT
jgi:Tol biopolymer transport system component